MSTAALGVGMILYNLVFAHLPLPNKFFEKIYILNQTVDKSMQPSYFVLIASTPEIEVFDIYGRFSFLFLIRILSQLSLVLVIRSTSLW